ncbi:DUF58 domain-containing protein [uncultured Paracoccus sp.]|uniref:DUF58 domain-containing protein n=1 Tax=uncultured Paracoccus sp. TaxID=189685 RepID=UPI0025FA6C33|nr:DUF58 domain-containing protein [uncultured Paracoccus sp.]
MVALPAGLPDAPGIRLTAAELLALRDQATGRGRHRPLTRRAGAVPARMPGAGMDLREIRAYVAGDDPRRLDPAATARTGHPHIRSLHEDRDDTLLLLADFRAPMLWGTGAALRSVRAARHLAQAGWTVALRGGSVAALMAGAALAERRGAGGDGPMAAICHALARQHDQALSSPGHAPLSKALARAMRLSPSGGRVLVATCLDGLAGAGPALADLARRRSVTLALILDDAEVRPPSGPLAIRDGQHGRIARLTAPDLSADLTRLRALGALVEEVAP